MPVVAERQLSNVGMPLPTYRNQVAFYDMFGEENGSTNFNIAVTGTSGAGKSFLTQGILRDVLNAGGMPGLSTWGTATRTTVTRPAGFISMALNCALTRSPTSGHQSLCGRDCASADGTRQSDAAAGWRL
jgi:hypothetical protein